ncbi:MAG TPA: UvrD-helicase domain-containing protein, partial [Nitrososphaera sp.]|nr:UvrD-helicase domain-containing protein [Nitrososphaera sp.]
MPSLSELNAQQREAVRSVEGPLMVVAGPGSGKTRVMTYRIAHLIGIGVPAYRILALTFTNKAANEMKSRIVQLVGEPSRQIRMGTFHSVFAR